MLRHDDAVTSMAMRQPSDTATQVLLEAARVLSTSLELDETLHQVLGLFVPRFADYGLLYLRTADGTFRQAAAQHVDPAMAGVLEELGRIYRPDLANVNSRIAGVLATRRPFLGAVSPLEGPRSAPDDPALIRIFQQLRPVSYVIIPLVARDQLLGCLALGASVRGREFERADLELAELVGARAALAIDNACLHQEARATRDRALRSAQLESQLVRARLEALRAQLNPHFLFNALNVVAMLVRRGANDDALRAVVSLSELLRRVLAAGTTLEVSLRDELALVRSFLEVEQLRFRDRLTASVVLDDAVVDATVPGLILQPIVENAIKHGVAVSDGPGIVGITARRDGARLILCVSDNGPGFPDGWDTNGTRGGVGLANLRERLQRMYDGDYRLVIGRGADGGARVDIDIPLKPAGSPAAAS